MCVEFPQSPSGYYLLCGESGSSSKSSDFWNDRNERTECNWNKIRGRGSRRRLGLCDHVEHRFWMCKSKHYNVKYFLYLLFTPILVGFVWLHAVHGNNVRWLPGWLGTSHKSADNAAQLFLHLFQSGRPNCELSVQSIFRTIGWHLWSNCILQRQHDGDLCAITERVVVCLQFYARWVLFCICIVSPTMRFTSLI